MNDHTEYTEPVVDNFFLMNNDLKNSATGMQRALQPGQTP